MTNVPTSSGTADEADAQQARPSPGTYPGTPRWVKVSGIATLVIILLVVLIMAILGGEHGPMRHIPSATWASVTPLIAFIG